MPAGLTTAEALAAEGRILAAGFAEAIAGSYIVKVKDDTDPNALAGKFGATVERTYRNALKGFAGTLSERQAKRLAADPSVEFVEQNQVFHADTTQPNPLSWGLDRVDQRNLPLSTSYNYTSTGAGAGVNVYVIDTGLRVTHTTFGGRAKNGYDFVDNDAVAQDGNGHGTHVAGTIAGSQYGIAKAATVYGVRVLNNAGSGTTAGVVAGIDWVTANAVKPAAANMSLGGGASATLDAAVRRSIAAGVTYGLAAGNSNTNAGSTSPARVTEAITVGPRPTPTRGPVSPIMVLSLSFSLLVPGSRPRGAPATPPRTPSAGRRWRLRTSSGSWPGTCRTTRPLRPLRCRPH